MSGSNRSIICVYFLSTRKGKGKYECVCVCVCIYIYIYMKN